ncbi:hypothetical protein BCH_01932 [Brucella sp. 191011898]|nr:hypothetical protein BCH_01932 [Brucella sp. 191011898]
MTRDDRNGTRWMMRPIDRTIRAYPSKANCFYHNDLETLGGSLNELIETGDGINGPLEPGCYSVAVYWWGDDVAFRFEVKADGTAHFVRSGEVH